MNDPLSSKRDQTLISENNKSKIENEARVAEREKGNLNEEDASEKRRGKERWRRRREDAREEEQRNLKITKTKKERNILNLVVRYTRDVI